MIRDKVASSVKIPRTSLNDSHAHAQENSASIDSDAIGMLPVRKEFRDECSGITLRLAPL